MGAKKTGGGRASYVVTYERDADGWWVASIEAVPGCHTQGRTLRQARERIREALEAALVDMPQRTAAKVAREAELVDDVRLPAAVADPIAASVAARREASEVEERAQALTRAAVEALTGAGVSRRDAAELLGMSHQRVQQLTAA